MTTGKILQKFPTLNSERLDFIEIKQEHLSDIFKLFGDDNVTEFYKRRNFATVDVLG